MRFRSRTNRQEPFRREFENLENPIVVEFVNAREDADRIKFFSKYGLLFVEKLIHPAAKNFGSDYDFVIASQTELREFADKGNWPASRCVAGNKFIARTLRANQFTANL